MMPSPSVLALRGHVWKTCPAAPLVAAGGRRSASSLLRQRSSGGRRGKGSPTARAAENRGPGNVTQGAEIDLSGNFATKAPESSSSGVDRQRPAERLALGDRRPGGSGGPGRAEDGGARPGNGRGRAPAARGRTRLSRIDGLAELTGERAGRRPSRPTGGTRVPASGRPRRSRAAAASAAPRRTAASSSG